MLVGSLVESLWWIHRLPTPKIVDYAYVKLRATEAIKLESGCSELVVFGCTRLLVICHYQLYVKSMSLETVI